MAETNWANRTIWTGDNLPIMRGMNSESVDLIYLDPPFNSKANYAAPIGSAAAGAEFKDTWTLSDIDEAWLYLLEGKRQQKALWRVIQAAMTNSDKSYLVYMAVRLLEMKRLLKPTGSIYLHCDPTMSHYLKLLMDSVFGRENFLTQIVWKRSGAHSDGKQGRKQHGRTQDNILFYASGKDWLWNPQYTPYSPEYLKNYRYVEETSGRRYLIDNITGPGGAAKGNPSYEIFGVTRYWRYSKERMNELIAQGRIVQSAPGRVPGYKRYLDEMPGVPLQDIWTDVKGLAAQSKERTGYPTQKPIALLDRIIKASSNEGDVVFDPFCGCATTCVAAELLTRQWVGIDISPRAADLVESRLKGNLKGDLGVVNAIVRRTDNPQRNDLGNLPPYNSPKLKNALYGEQGGDCNGCGTHFQKQHLTVDHIIAQSKGGTDHIENLQLLCAHCNSVKGDRGQEYLLAKLAA